MSGQGSSDWIGSKKLLMQAVVLILAIGTMGFSITDSKVGGPATLRRLTQEQYRNVIADVFGADIELGGRFEPDPRASGLIAIGVGQANVTGGGIEQYDSLARTIARQVTDERHRALFVPCVPRTAEGPDTACARQFLFAVGELLFRRPLADGEIEPLVAGVESATLKLGDFYQGLGLGLAALLTSPQFLYRLELSEPHPDRDRFRRLTSFAKAERLSFFLWNSGPDAMLLAAARSGALHTEKGLAQQVDRMLASPRLEAGMRAFYSDMLEFDRFDTLVKDTAIFPKFSDAVVTQAREQTLRTIVNLLIREQGDYRDLFTTPRTEMTVRLGSLYRIPVHPPNDVLDAWTPYEFASDSGHAGILTHISFVALHSHPGRSSPTLRGKALREIFMCQKVPDPPNNVDFSNFNEQSAAGTARATARGRLESHASNPVCAGCHKITDPIGLAMENFDTIGAFRTHENGAIIDTSGKLGDVAYGNASGMGMALHDNPALPACLVSRIYDYGVGRRASPEEARWITEALEKQFATDNYRLLPLLRRIATSENFYRIAPAAGTDLQIRQQ